MNWNAYFLFLCSLTAHSQTLLWDHVDVRNTSFVIRRTSNVKTHWTNWPVVATVHHTNAWKIPVRAKKCDLFTVQASNQFGMSCPPTCGVWRAQSTPERTFTASQVGMIVKKATTRAPVKPPPLP